MREVHADLLQGEARPKFKERRHEVHSSFLYESLDGRCSFTLLEHALYFPCKRKRLFQCAALGRLCPNVVPSMVGRQLKGVIAVHLAKGTFVVNNIPHFVENVEDDPNNFVHFVGDGGLKTSGCINIAVHFVDTN